MLVWHEGNLFLLTVTLRGWIALHSMLYKNGNPFVQVQYAQAGQQPHPLLYAKPKDPFHNL